MKNSMQHCCLKMSCQVPSSTKNIELDMHFCRICAYMAKLKRLKFIKSLSLAFWQQNCIDTKCTCSYICSSKSRKLCWATWQLLEKKLGKSGKINFYFPFSCMQRLIFFYWFHPNAPLCICRRWDDMDHSYVVHFSVINAFYWEVQALNDDQRKCRCLELVSFRYQWYSCLNINCCFIIDVRF